MPELWYGLAGVIRLSNLTGTEWGTKCMWGELEIYTKLRLENFMQRDQLGDRDRIILKYDLEISRGFELDSAGSEQDHNMALLL
jgi:hypothetical protein